MLWLLKKKKKKESYMAVHRGIIYTKENKSKLEIHQ